MILAWYCGLVARLRPAVVSAAGVEAEAIENQQEYGRLGHYSLIAKIQLCSSASHAAPLRASIRPRGRLMNSRQACKAERGE
jgi:hypothetical protein